jgi:hypothetical protein
MTLKGFVLKGSNQRLLIKQQETTSLLMMMKGLVLKGGKQRL